MSDFFSIRNYPAFRRYFDAVHPFFWPVLYWQLKRAWLFLQREKLTSVLLAITWWGGVRIVHLGDKLPDSTTYRPVPRLFRPLTDESWASGLPSDIAALETLRLHSILPCARGGGGWPLCGQTVGAFAPCPATS